jgi:hypothetical protein
MLALKLRFVDIFARRVRRSHLRQAMTNFGHLFMTRGTVLHLGWRARRYLTPLTQASGVGEGERLR